MHDQQSKAAGESKENDELVPGWRHAKANPEVITRVLSLDYRFNHETAEELAALVVSRSWLSSAKITGTNPDGWLRAVTRNVANDYLSDRKREVPAVNLTAAAEVPAAEAPLAGGRPLLGSQLSCALCDLPPRQREVVLCRFCLQLENDEIALLLGITVSTVRGMWRSAKLALRSHPLVLLCADRPQPIEAPPSNLSAQALQQSPGEPGALMWTASFKRARILRELESLESQAVERIPAFHQFPLDSDRGAVSRHAP